MKNNFTKSLLSWILVFSLVLPLMSSVIYTQAADSDIKDYDSMTMEEILASDESLTWVITGDSITHNGNWTAELNSYGEWMEQYLYDNAKRVDDSVVLTGWGGAATDDFQTAANTNSNQGTNADPGMGLENFVTKYNPDVITIKLGMNDRYIAKATFIKYYKQMLDSIYSICETEHKKIPKIVVLTPSPIVSENHLDDIALGEVPDGVYESTSRQRNALEQIVKDYNAAGKNILFCDLRTAFLDEEQAMGADYAHTFFQDPSDGAIHPNGAGQYLIFKTLAKTLGIYDETMPIFQIEYEDLVSHALYVDSTDGVTYTGDYDTSTALPDVDDNEEMNKTMPSVTDVTPISSVEFDSSNGVLDMKGKEGFSLTTEAEGVDTLTQDEASSLGDDFSVVFRARLGSAYSTNQPVLFISSNGTANWNNALVLGVPGSSQQMYYNFLSNDQLKAAKSGGFSLSGSTIANDGVWHTVAVVQDSGTIKYYVDGTLVDSKSGYGLASGVESIGSMFANSENFAAQIGRYGTVEDGTSYVLNGSLDYWQLYNSALTAEQVLTLAGDDAGNEKTTSWSDTVVENYTWAVAGGAQMAGYDGIVVNRSLMRYIENAMRGSSGVASYRDIHMYNLASAGYDVATLVEKYDTLAAERAYNVFMLLPEIPEVYESDYVHSNALVAAYKNNIKTLLSKNSGKVVVLWTPLASNDTTINGYIDDYANAVREIAGSDTSILFFDANKFMNDNMTVNASLLNNWFEDGQYVTPLCNADLARAFFETMAISGTGKAEISDHTLRYTSDKKVFKGNYVRDNIKANATVDGTTVTVDVSAIATAYPNAELSIAVLPHKTVENYNENIVKLSDVATVAVDVNVYTFKAPCADLNLAIYGEQDGLIYRFKDISLDVETTATIPAPRVDGVYLDSLEVMSAPAIGFDKDTTTYNVDLYQYQTYASVRATAQAGLTIKVNDEVVASNEIAKAIKVEDGSVVTVEVTDGTETKTYTLNMSRPSSPDIIITEVMTDGYSNYTASGNDNYELIEIYNASGKDLNLLDYSVGYKKDYTYNTVTVGNGAEFPYYFTGNDLAVSKETHAGIKELTKYSMYWEDKVDEEPEEVIFKADSTMVIWVKFSPQGNAADRATYGAKLTYETLIAALEAHKGTHTLSVDIDGTDTAVVPEESQIVVAEASVDMVSGSLAGAADRTAENSQKNWYLENHGRYNSGGQQTRSWLFILKDTAEVASNRKVTEAGNDIISAAKYVRAAKVIGKDANGKDIVLGTDKLSSVFSYNFERGMSLVRNESYINDDLIGVANTSDVMGYSNLTSFGAIEYWQKPTDFGDKEAPTVTNNTLSQVASGAEGIISLDLADNADVRYMEAYVRKAGEAVFTKVATKDFVLESGVKNAGVSADITSTTYTYSVGEVTDVVEYYVVVTDGNGNTTSEGTEQSPCKFTLIPKIVQDYTAEEAAAYIGEEAPKCEQQGYLFSGWYADEACKASPIQNADEVEGTVYALFVTDDVLTVKAQISTNLGNEDKNDDATGSIRFVTTVDSLNYLQAGFKVSYDKDGEGEGAPTNVTKASNKVYKKLYAVDATSGEILQKYEPTVFSSVSTYFKACTVTGVPEANYATDFTVTPFWVTPDGMEVEGVTTVKSIKDGMNSDAEAEIDGSFYDSLEEAITVANSEADVTTITILNDAEVESQLRITTDVTIQNPERENITIYRGSGLAATDMFSVASGATLTIKGVDDKGTLVLDGRTKAEAAAETTRDAAVGSTGSLISNFGNLNIDNVTVQYVRKTGGTGGVINSNSDNATNANAMVTITDSVFDNNYSSGYGSVLYSRAKSEITGSTFTNNKSSSNGGVICNHSGSLFTVDDSLFAYNQGAQGGVIWNDKVATITNSSFDSNTATNKQGGAIKNSGTANITDTSFTNNTSAGTDSEAGAVYNSGTLNLTGTAGNLDKALFDNNTASKNGGAILTWTGTVNVENYTFTNNSVDTNIGGAIYSGKATLNITDSKFTGNSSVLQGGAVVVASTSYGTITGTSDMALFEGNSVTGDGAKGGAVYFGSGTLTITGYTFRENTSADVGGAIQIQAPATISSCVFDSNTAKTGGAINTINTLGITNSKFTGNTATVNGGAIYKGEGSTTLTITGDGTDSSVFANNKATGTQSGEKFTDTTNFGGGAICIGNGNLTVSGYKFTSNETYSNGGAINNRGASVTINDCEFSSNKAVKHTKDGYGGAIFMNAGTLNVDVDQSTDTKFEGNRATYGGAIAQRAGTATLHNANFTSNTADWNAGAIYSMATMNLTNCDFTSNTTVSKGGAICGEGGTLNVTGCDFVGNISNDEGGACRLAAGITATFKTCTFTNNTAKNVGGGAFKFHGNTLTIDGCTFTGNTATKGDANGHDIKLSTTTTKPTIKNSTFNKSNVRDSAGTAGAYTDGGGNTTE